MTTTPTRGRAGSTKRDIVVEAAALFAARGFAAVSVQDIGERVGITGGAIYRHYPSKDAVLHAVMLDIIERWLAVARDAEAASGPALGRLVSGSVHLVVERPGELATYVRERPRVEKSVRGELAARERELFGLWSGAMVAARPELTRGDVVVRQQAINAVLSSLAVRPEALAQSRLRNVIIGALISVVTTPPAAGAVEPGSAERAWTAPVPRREQIIATAMRLFAERGYHGVSMGDIGDAVGMAGPSLYEHVASKSDILLDAYDRAGAFVVAGASTALATATSATDALDRLVVSYVGAAFEHVDLLVVTSREGASVPETERPRLARRRRDLHEQWAAVLRELRPDISLADARVLVRSALALIGALARHRRDDSPSVEATATLARALLTGGADRHPNSTAEKEQL